MSDSNSGFFAPDSVTWRVHSDPSMVVGGIRALLEQALHPEAMSGVAAHSNFREDAWGRLQRTGDYVGTLTFGTQEEAEKLAARVRKVHAMLKLDDQKLLLWVHMAMVDAFLDTAIRSGLQLSEAEQDRYIDEMITFALLLELKSREFHEVDANSANIFVRSRENFLPAMMPNAQRSSLQSHLCLRCSVLELLSLRYGAVSHRLPQPHCRVGRVLCMDGQRFSDMTARLILL